MELSINKWGKNIYGFHLRNVDFTDGLKRNEDFNYTMNHAQTGNVCVIFGIPDASFSAEGNSAQAGFQRKGVHAVPE